MSRLLLIGVFILASSSFIYGQRRDAPDATCNLTVQVRNSMDRAIDKSVQIELLSPQGTPIYVVRSSDDGRAEFRVANGAVYRLRVSGEGWETTTTPDIVIFDREQMHMETVNVEPEEKTEKPKSAPVNSATISVAEMNIPSKAKKEMDKGLEAYGKGDLVTARKHFEKAAEEYPQYAHAYSNLGVIDVKESNRDAARQMFAKAMQVDAKFLPAYVNLARMDFQDKDYIATEALLQKVMAVNPAMPDATALLASAEYMNKEYDKALADARRTHELQGHEQFAEVHLMAGKIMEMRNHPDAAIAEYQTFLKENPSSPRAELVRKDLAQLEAGKN